MQPSNKLGLQEMVLLLIHCGRERLRDMQAALFSSDAILTFLTARLASWGSLVTFVAGSRSSGSRSTNARSSSSSMQGRGARGLGEGHREALLMLQQPLKRFGLVREQSIDLR